MENFVNFFRKYGGAIVGGIIALILGCTSFYRFAIIVVFVIFGAWLGNFIQCNKELVKEKLKNLIDKM